MINVTINRDALKLHIKNRIRVAIANHQGSFIHTNHDRFWTPSEWNYNRPATRRRSLITTGSMSLDGDTIKILLSYEAIDIPPR